MQARHHEVFTSRSLATRSTRPKSLLPGKKTLSADIIDIIIGEVGGVGSRSKQVAGAVVMLSTQGRHGSFEASRGGGDQ